MLASLSALVLAATAGVPSSRSQDAVEAKAWEEEYAWALARRTGTPEAYQWFLEQYPDSRFSAAAFRAVVDAAIDAADQPAPPPVGRALSPLVSDEPGESVDLAEDSSSADPGLY